MSGFYNGLAATALALIKDKGAEVTWTSEAYGDQDATTLVAARTATSTKIMAVEVSLPEREIDGTLVQRGDIKLLLGGVAGFTPKVGDVVTLASGEAARCIAPKRVAPAGTLVMWTVVVRSGG